MITTIKLFKESLSQDLVQQTAEIIQDWAASGQGAETDFESPCEGLVLGKQEIKSNIDQLSDQQKIELSELLKTNYLDASQGWSQGDVNFLNNLGLSIDIELDEDQYYDSFVY